MKIEHLPFDRWLVIEHSHQDDVALISEHATQFEAEAERDRRNQAAHSHQYRACMVLEPVAQRMGGHRCPGQRTK